MLPDRCHIYVAVVGRECFDQSSSSVIKPFSSGFIGLRSLALKSSCIVSQPSTVWTPMKKGSITNVSMTSKRMIALEWLSVSVALRRVVFLAVVLGAGLQPWLGLWSCKGASGHGSIDAYAAVGERASTVLCNHSESMPSSPCLTRAQPS